MGRNLPEPEQRKPETVRKAKKRKRDEAVLDLPDGVVADLPGASVEQSEDKVEAEARQKKKKKKKKQDRMEGLSNGHLDGAGAEGAAEGGDGKKKKKKRAGTDESAEAREASTLKEKKKKSKESTPLDPSSDKSKKKRKNDQAAENAEDSPVADQSGDPQKSDRFIVFIGNLPFTANKSSIEKHFESVKPDSVRHITHKDQPSKSKGFAFLEFSGYDRMKTCLKLYHHSQFEDGLSAGRRINVELTAGGGGSKSGDRKSKLKVKNEKLNEERKRRQLEEEKARKENSGKTNEEAKGNAGDSNDNSGIHPSRRSRVPLR